MSGKLSPFFSVIVSFWGGREQMFFDVPEKPEYVENDAVLLYRIFSELSPYEMREVEVVSVSHMTTGKPAPWIAHHILEHGERGGFKWFFGGDGRQIKK